MVVFFNNVLESVSDEATYRAVPLFSEGQLKISSIKSITFPEPKISTAVLSHFNILETFYLVFDDFQSNLT